MGRAVAEDDVLERLPARNQRHPRYHPGTGNPLDLNGSETPGGDGEARTPDLLHAMQALSQLSYVPGEPHGTSGPGRRGRKVRVG